MIKFYTETGHYKKKNRAELHPFLRPFFKKASQDELMNIYGSWIRDFKIVDDPGEADIFFLPMSWNFYYKKGKSYAQNFTHKVKSFGKPIFAWTSGDFGVEPLDNNVVTFRPSGYRTKISASEKGMQTGA